MKKSTAALAISGLFLACFSVSMNAQPGGEPGCGTSEYRAFLIKNGQFVEPISAKGGPGGPQAGILEERCGQLPEVPVVVHISHKGEVVGSGSNVSDAQIQAAIDGLNDKWHNTNGLGVNMEITFRLARRDPMGNPTNGIVRTNASAVPGYAANGISFMGSAGANDTDIKDLSKWPVADYYNIWVVSTINGFPAGYAYYPNGSQYDGTIIRASSMTYGSGTLAHELGHAWNLAHTFDGDDTGCPPDVDCTTDGDGVCDTPPHKQADCGAANPCSAMGIWDNSRYNIMSYCSGNRFTAGQKQRANVAMYSSVRRFLLESLGLIPPANLNEMSIEKLVFPDQLLCSPTFKPIVRIKNWGTSPASSFEYELFLDGISQGTFLQTAVSIPAGQTLEVELDPFSVGTGGHSIQIKLLDINGAGLDSHQYDNEICSFFEQKPAVTDLCEDFETGLFQAWMTYQDTAQIYPVFTATNCPTQQDISMAVNAINSTQSTYNFLFGPLDLSGLGGSPWFSFDLARERPYYCNNFASLRITASSDCGKTTTLLYHKNDSPMFPCGGVTTPPTAEILYSTTGVNTPTSVFLPDACSDWRKEVIDLAAFAGQSSVVLKFEVDYEVAFQERNIIYFDNFCLNKCSPPTAPFQITSAPADTMWMCQGGTTPLTMQTNSPDDKNVGYIWQRGASMAGPFISEGYTKTYGLNGNAIGNYVVRGIALKNGCADTIFTTVIVTPDIAVGMAPVNATACLGEPISLTGTFTGGPPNLVFQWQSGPTGGGPWSPEPNSGTATWTPPAPVGTTYYRLTATSPLPGCVLVSTFYAQVKVDEPIVITSQPTEILECLGGNNKLIVAATGGGIIKYQWRRGPSPTGPWSNFSGNNSQIQPPANTLGTIYYQCVLTSTNSFCTDTTVIVAVQIVADPSISQQPMSITGCGNSTATLLVNATGGVDPLLFQWRTSSDLSTWNDISGATTNTVQPTPGVGVNYYQVIISSAGSGCATVTSSTVSVAIDEPIFITAEPSPINQCLGAFENLTIGQTGAAFFQWQQSASPGGPFTNASGGVFDSYNPGSGVIGTVYFRVILRSQNSFCRDTSVAVAVNTVGGVQINDQPDSYSGCLGNAVNLTVGSSGGVAPLSFQWQSSAFISGPFADINGATSASYAAPNTPGTIYYQVIVSSPGGANCASVTSNTTTVTLDGQGAIATEPLPINECIGGTQSFSTTTTAGGPFNFQWQTGPTTNGPFVNIGGNSMNFQPSAAAAGNTFYRLILSSTNGLCKDTSLVVQAQVVPNASINVQPASLSGCLGNPVNLSVNATGGIAPLNFQWQNSPAAGGPFSNINGSTSTTYNVPNNPGSQFFQVIINSAAGSGCPAVTSTVATISLDQPVNITADPTDFSECVGGSKTMTVTATGAGALFQWQNSTAAGGPFTNISGATMAAFQPPSATVGTTYFRVIVRSANGFCKDTSLVAAAQIVLNASITSQPVSFAGCLGMPLNLTVSATGGLAPLDFQWQNGPAVGGPFTNINGSTSTSYAVPNNPGSQFFQVIINSTAGSGCPAITSQVATVSLDQPVNITADPTAISECIGGSKTMTVGVNGAGAMIQWQSSTGAGGPFANIPGALTTTYQPLSATVGTTYFRVIVRSANGFCKDTSLVVAAQIVLNASISSQPVGYSGCLGNAVNLTVGATGGIGPLTFQWQNSAAAGGPFSPINGATSTSYVAPNNAGTQFFQVVINSVAGSGCPAVTSSAANVTLDGQVSITSQPTPISECIGGGQSLSATATGSGVLTFQWQNSASAGGPFLNINGANSASYVVPNMAAANGFFQVIISSPNGFCKDTTTVVQAQIFADPSISGQPLPFSGCAGDPVSLNATATGGAGILNFQWQNSSTAGGPFSPINGANSTSYVAPNGAGTMFYQLVVSSAGAGCGTATSAVTQVAIDAAVAVLMQPQNVVECLGGTQNLTTTSSGSPTYQWQVGPTANGPFSNIPGATTANFMPPAVAAGTVFYRLILASMNGNCRDTSAVSSVQTVNDLTISPQPVASYEACVGGVLTLNSGATGGISPQFQWQTASSAAGPWANVPGATQPNFSPPLTTGGTFFYQLLATSNGSGCAAATSNTAQILLHPEVQISTQPVAISECFGGNQTLTGAATGGTNLTFQWQIQLPGGGWQNVAGANSATYLPPSTVNNSSKNYRLFVADVNLACGADTSAAVNVAVKTDFSVQNTLDVCNFGSGPQPETVDFTSLILTGDPNPTWQSIDAPQPPGPWSAKDFTGWIPGMTFRFVATTTNAVAPCKNVSDTIFIKILDCCPLACTNPPTASLCNSGGQPLILADLQCPGIGPGAWFLTGGPGVSGQQPLANGLFDAAGLAAGQYSIAWILSGPLPATCAASSAETVNVIATPDAGQGGPPTVFCENINQLVDLKNLLTGEDVGGKWTDDSPIPAAPGAFIAQNGTLQTNNLQPGSYYFQYEIAGVGACPGDDETLEIVIGAVPNALAGADQTLTCDLPAAQIGSGQNPSAGGGLELLWTEISHAGFVPDSTGGLISIAEPGVYVLEIGYPLTGCFDRDTVAIDAALSFITDVAATVSEPTCASFSDGKIEVTGVTGGTPPLLFSLNGGAAGSIQSFSKLKAGVYNLQVVDIGGCSTERNIVLVDPPVLTVGLRPDTTLFCGDSLLLTAATNWDTALIFSVLWLSNITPVAGANEFELLVSPMRNQSFSVKIENENGCRAEASVRLLVNDELPIYAPNVFKPGSDLNDRFRIFSNDKVKIVRSLRIFDRPGGLLFEQLDRAIDDQDFGWDGRFRADFVAPGVFVYVCELEFCDGRTEVVKGSVTVVR